MKRALVLFLLVGCQKTRDQAADAAPPAASLHYRAHDSRKVVTVHPNERFDVSLASPRAAGQAIEWGAPVVDGGCVFEGKQVVEPPANVDGGSFTHVYTFVAKSKCSLRIPRVPDPGNGAFSIEVNVI